MGGKGLISIHEFTQLCSLKTFKKFETFQDFEYQVSYIFINLTLIIKITHTELFQILTLIATLYKEKSDKIKEDDVLVLLKPIEPPIITSQIPVAVKTPSVVILDTAPAKNSKLDIKTPAVIVVPAVVAVPVVVAQITFLISKPMAKMLISPPPKMEIVEHLEVMINKLMK